MRLVYRADYYFCEKYIFLIKYHKQPVRINDELFAVTPKLWCEHLEEHVNTAPQSLEAKPKCVTCEDSTESWYCLSCYEVHQLLLHVYSRPAQNDYCAS